MDCLNNFISLGPHCCPRMRLDWIKSKNGIEITKTNFFDYLMVNNETIKTILDTESIETIFNKTNINIYGYGADYLSVELNNIFLRSIHDVTNDIDKNRHDSNIQEQFIDKYIRRYHRLIDTLNNNKKTFFIYQGNISYEDYIEFDKIFKKKFTNKIIIISFLDFGESRPIIERFENLYYLNYNSMYLTKDYVYESSMEFLNWDLIFQHMKNIHDENN